MTASQLLKNKIFLFIILIGMFEPRCVGELSVYRGGVWTLWHRIDVVLIYSGAAFILVLYFSILRKISLISIATILFQLCWILADLNNGLSIYSDTRNAIQMIALVMLVELSCKMDFKIQLVDVISFVLGLFIIINFITILFYPNGMYVDNRNWWANWFFGYKNSHVYVYLVYMACAAIRDIMKWGKLKLRYYLMVILMAVAAILANTATTTVILLVLAVLIIFFHNVKFPKWFNAATAMVVSAVLSLLMIVFNFQSNFSGILEVLFQRTDTFSARTSIWAAALPKVLQHPVFGNGASYVSTTLFSNWDVGQCHNNFLDILFVGGIVLMAIFIWIQYLTCSRLIKARGEPSATILTFTWIGYAILFLMEARRNDVYIYVVYALAYFINYYNVGSKNVRVGISKNRRKIKIRLRKKLC